MWKHSSRSFASILIGLLCSCVGDSLAGDVEIKAALTLHASFDSGSDADYAKGDKKLYTWVDRKGNIKKAGLHTEGKSVIAEGAGKFGSALEFKAGDAPWVFYLAKNNLSYKKENWGGSISLWLKCDPVAGLAKGYCDPVQLTPRAWNDAAFFLDFNKEGSPRDFRLGAYADLKVWNPEKKEVPESERPLLTAKDPGFGKDKWTHVVFTWEGFNSGSDKAVAKLYIDGEPNGTLSGWNQQFTWADSETSRLLLGLLYVGMLDEFSCFDRALTPKEVKSIHGRDGGVGGLLK
ncbi:MAG: LamG-like jellyroll fold domain-containing protein [Verrucomicrobiales bacterium]